MSFEITTFFGNKVPYSQNDHVQKTFLEDLSFYIVKGCHPLFSIENTWLK